MSDTGFKRFMRYCLVGGIGFCTDGGLLQLGIHLMGWGVIVARVPSFLIAVLVTWYLNRGFTFRKQHISFRESFPSYIAANAVGLAINFGSYSAGVLFSPFMAQYPLLPLAIGAVLGMVFNFFAARWIFRDD
ncbi:MAG: GtrA family protein [Rhodospirillales bacterium]|nr:GtrA family protein [Rhodospirillales bacterium]MCB9996676.1 GtrA family protein [Rhodospirillales bacterium]